MASNKGKLGKINQRNLLLLRVAVVLLIDIIY